MTSPRAIALGAAFIFLALSAPHAIAEGTWEADKIGEMKAETVRLRDQNGQIVDTISVAQVRTLLSVQERIASASGIPAKLVITEGKSPNAFATDAAGYNIIAFNTAMLKLLGDDVDAMATIMGHELGHLAKGHVRAKIEREKALGLLGMMAGFAFDREMARKIGASSNAGQNFAQFAAKMISAQFDRDQEREADAIGVAWMYKAGYDPSAALRLWQRMPEGGGLLSDHPASSERYQLISMQIASFPGQQGSAVARVPLPAQSPSVKTTDYREPTYGPGDPYTMMMVAYNQGRYQEAFSFAMMSAAARDPRGQAAVGMLYRDGVGTDQDYAKAEYYYGLAAAQGSAVANNSIATLIMDGHSSIKDPTVAAAYYQKAADANYPGALAGLGIMKISGTMGIPQDETGGRALLLRASDANDPLAAWFVATAIIRGQTMQKDYTEAFRLMSIAWQGGVNLAGSDLALMYARGQGVAQSIPKAKGLLEASFKDGNAIAAYYLGVMYKDGEGVPADKVRAYAYLDLAVKMGARNAVKMRDTRGALLSIDEITQALSLEQILQPRKTGIYRTKG